MVTCCFVAKGALNASGRAELGKEELGANQRGDGEFLRGRKSNYVFLQRRGFCCECATKRPVIG